MRFRLLFSLCAGLLLAGSALAHGFRAGELQIRHPFVRATMPGQPTGAAYFSIENEGKKADRLIGATTTVAGSVQIHAMNMDGNIMRMREVAAVDIAPGAKVSLKPGDGMHLMLMELKQPLKQGDKFPLTLNFEKAGKVEVTVVVDKEAAQPAAADHQHHH
ncbi:hypothetical protein SAMN06265795_101467 [Noviherbaspirillum humi]|uniref:Copper(I)-binding protein n=1 Tax=Noviherbaspirillum humi TaxID=1688639 RepID=A0A239CHJ9_9BURK|nr:copper chaperone PCu(A)C [Noviherbaspirillum humi]SNS19590.1 hypothetical protein SAMN06265795_101467 [Noviherbaspirillum humi]